MKNSVLIIVIATMLCFAVAGKKIYTFVGGFYPVAEAEECVKVVVDGIPVKLLILKNLDDRLSSIVYSLNSRSLHEVSYAELREMDAEKVACE